MRLASATRMIAVAKSQNVASRPSICRRLRSLMLGKDTGELVVEATVAVVRVRVTVVV